jgi:phosphopantothenoylcysteine synthetase/decarboxylase
LSTQGSLIVDPYLTFDDLSRKMEWQVRSGSWDAVIHCAAVSDYQVAGVYAAAPGTRFVQDRGSWEADDQKSPTLEKSLAAKVKSDEVELWLRLVRTPKLVDRVRSQWDFHGVLVKFKLEVGVTDERLLEIAEQSRVQSSADLMVANTLEDKDSWALLGPIDGRYQRVSRAELAERLVTAIEELHRGEKHG